MPSMTFRLDIEPREYQRYYRGVGNTVRTVADDGRSLSFPAAELRKFVTHSGVQGRFRIEFDSSNKLVSLVRLGD